MVRNCRILVLAIAWQGAAALADGQSVSANEPEPAYTHFLSCSGDLLSEGFRANTEELTFFVIHGYLGSTTDRDYLKLASAIRTRFPAANVILVDWRPSKANLPMPFDYVYWTKQASPTATDIVKWMLEQNVSPSKTILCGHSLGAQVAAFVGQEAAKDECFGQPICAILATDPAGPLFQGQSAEYRLDRSDAQEVVVVHTTEVLGDETSLGTIDTYVRWPESQKDIIAQHGYARALLRRSLLDPRLSHIDGTPLGVNALGFHHACDEPRDYYPPESALPDRPIATLR